MLAHPIPPLSQPGASSLKQNILLLVAFATLLPAQEKGARQQEAEIQEANAVASKAAADFAQLEGEYKRAHEAWREPWIAARRAKDEAKVAELDKQKPAPKFIARFQEGARKYAGTDGAVPYLNWILSEGRYGVGGAKAALATLLKDHVKSPQLDRVPLIVLLLVTRESYDMKQALDHLARLVEHSPSELVKMRAHYYRAEILRREGSTAEEKRSAKLEYLAAIELGGDERLVQNAKSAIYELDNLGIGMVAPDIEGEDLDGVAFKLSDYRGKVILLDFWGHW